MTQVPAIPPQARRELEQAAVPRTLELPLDRYLATK
jgi:hypothetical protein